MSFEDTTVLVTGGAGFIGSHLVEHLLAEGASVRVLDDFSTGRRENLAPFAHRIDLHEASVTELSECRAACAGVDYVLHEASLPSVQRSVTDPRPTHAVSATGTLNMLHAAAQEGVRRFVYAGSSSAYGNTPTLPKHEGMATSPRSPYAVAKLAGEHYTQVFPALFGLETIVLRYFNVFGPRQDPHSPYSAAIPLFADAALGGRAPTILGDGGQTRDFTFVENVVDANFRACIAQPEGVVGEVFNVGCGERISIAHVWGEIRKITGADVDAEHAPGRAGEVRDSLADLTRIRERLGYEVKVPLAEGLRRTVAWLKLQREADGGEGDPVAS
jgi:nucleoside-diphosphate-sugar epimerase